MKLKHFLLSILAVAGLAAACEKAPEDLGEARLTVNPLELSLTAEAQSATVTFTATRDWTISTDADWVVLSATSGSASTKEQTVEVSVTANKGTNRETEVLVTIGLSDAKIKVSQVGEKGEEQPMTVTEFNATEADEKTVYLVKGTASSNYSSNYNYIYISDGTSECEIYKPTNSSDWTAKLVKGAIITVRGTHTLFTNTSGKQIHEITAGEILAIEEGEDTKPTDIKAATVAEFNAAAVSTTDWYRLSGTVGTGAINTTYGNFDLVDATGTVYVYGISNWADYKDKFAAGGKVVVVGNRGEYNSKIEVLNGYIESYEAGEAPQQPDVKDPITATVAEFKAAAESNDQPYKLTGVIANTSINTTYGNFDLVQGTDTVYVYGLTATNLGYGATNDKSYASLGLAAGDTLTLVGFRGSYNEKIEVVYPYYVSHKKGAGSGNNENPPAAAGTYDSNVTWTLVKNAYDNTSSGTSAQSAVVNGTTVSNLLKLGKSAEAGSATIKLPAGTKKVTYYGLAWSGKPSTLSIQLGGSEVYSQALAANTGVAGNAPYTITVADTDHYTFNLASALTADTEVTVTTSGSNYRIILFGIKAE